MCVDPVEFDTAAQLLYSYTLYRKLFKRIDKLVMMSWSSRGRWRGKELAGGVVRALSHTHQGEWTNTCSSKKS